MFLSQHCNEQMSYNELTLEAAHISMETRFFSQKATVKVGTCNENHETFRLMVFGNVLTQVHGISLESIPIESGSRFGVAKKLPLESPLATTYVRTTMPLATQWFKLARILPENQSGSRGLGQDLV